MLQHIMDIEKGTIISNNIVFIGQSWNFCLMKAITFFVKIFLNQEANKVHT